jgi:hypothetical protein
MYVNVKNFSFERSSRFFTFKNVNSWKIIRIINNKIYKFKFSNHLKIVEFISIFYSWKLHLTFIDSFLEQINSFKFFVIIIDSQIKKSHEKYEILNIVNYRRIAKRDLQYKSHTLTIEINEMQIHHDNQHQMLKMQKIKSIVFIEQIRSNLNQKFKRYIVVAIILRLKKRALTRKDNLNVKLWSSDFHA